MTTETDTKDVPYIPFPTLMNQVERMEDHPIPPQIDRSFLIGMSGGYQSQVIGTLKAIGFISDDLSVQPVFREFVNGDPETRKRILRDVVNDLYTPAINVSRANGTMKQLEDTFDRYGVSGSTKRKAVAFFLKAAEYAEMPLSPHFKLPRTRSLGTKRRVKPEYRGLKKKRVQEPIEPPTPTDLRQQYITLLLDRVQQADDLDPELMDRIERLLGFQGDEGDA